MSCRELIAEVADWSARPDASTFPLDAVIAQFRQAGKHFVERELLDVLAQARAALRPDDASLRRFLDTVLDKYDGRFDNPSYLALHDLPLPKVTGCPVHTTGAERQRDRLIALLAVDLVRFELAALDGTTDLMPLMRPGRRTVAKRCALALRLFRTALPRIGIDAETDDDDPIEAARVLADRIEATQTPEETHMLKASLLCVYTAHDEQLFVRMLQCYETTFALVAVLLRAAILSARTGDAGQTAQFLRTAARTMDEATPLFSIVATMLPEAFMAFREYTDGASAIQSRNYKVIESLCRRPDGERLSGPGYEAMPDVRIRALIGQPTLQETIEAATFDAAGLVEVHAAMAGFEEEMMGWRKTHHSIASHMLGMRRGTGYTSGVPYLAEIKDIPVFTCPFARGLAEAA
jgi:tryptophan 2,3-dioxygenase